MKGWEGVKEKLPRGFMWEVTRRNRKGRTMGGMLVSIKVGIRVVEKGTDVEEG